MTSSKELSHILFVDDVVMMGEGTWENVKYVEQIADLYKKATWMHNNVEKSILLENSLFDTIRNKLNSKIPYFVKPLS